MYDDQHDIIFDIYNIFIDWLPFEIYNMGELRGNYLELVSYRYMEEKYSETIYKESNVTIAEYRSHTWDLIIELNNSLQLYECKFSPKSLKRNHINQMIGLKNKLDISLLFLVLYDNKEIVEFNINQLREDTKKENYNQLLSNFNIITIENFNLSNPF